MKSYLLLFSLLFVCLLPAQAIHFFHGTYEEAREKARAENKNLLISFTTSWCGPCRIMKACVFEDEKVTQYVDEHYIALLLDIEFLPYQLLQQRISPEYAGSVPHVCILTPDEKVLKEAGSMHIRQMMKFLKTDPQTKPLRALLAAEAVSPLDTVDRLFKERTLYNDVLARARQEKKNMLLCFSSHFCGPCREMEKTTFRNPAILQKVRREYVTGYFEVGDLRDRALCMRYHNKEVGVPYLVIATPEEKIVSTRGGYLDSAAFRSFITPQPDVLPTKSISQQDIHLTEGQPSRIQKFLYNQSHNKWHLHINAAINTTTLKTGGQLKEVNLHYRAGYEVGFSYERAGKHFAVAPGLAFISKGGKNKEITLQQNYVELPVKLTWIYNNLYNSWWKGVSVAPYGSLRVGDKLKNKSTLPDEWFHTRRFDYGLRFATNLRFNSFDFEAGYQLGLQNISDHPGGKMYHRGFFLNVALCL